MLAQPAFTQSFSAIELRLLVQGPPAGLLPNVSFDYSTDSLTRTADLAAFSVALGVAAPTSPSQSQQYWATLTPLVSALGIPQSQYESALENVFSEQNLPFTLTEARSGDVFLPGAGVSQFIAGVTQFIAGNPGPHYFDGGVGNIYEQSPGGGDTFIFDQGYGHLEIHEEDVCGNPDNVLQLGSGITAAQITVTTDSSGDLILTDGTAGDQITLDNELGGSDYGVQSVQFASGGSLTEAQLIAMAATGTTGADTLYGSTGADVFDGRGAPVGSTDVEVGDGGGDTFIFDQGYGHLEIHEEDVSGNPDNVLQLGSGRASCITPVTAPND